jgi:hypothetical protein
MLIVGWGLRANGSRLVKRLNGQIRLWIDIEILFNHYLSQAKVKGLTLTGRRK